MAVADNFLVTSCYILSGLPVMDITVDTSVVVFPGHASAAP